MDKCKCGSYAINPGLHGRDRQSDLDLCDICYWRIRASPTGRNRIKAEAVREAIDAMPNFENAIFAVEHFSEYADKLERGDNNG